MDKDRNQRIREKAATREAEEKRAKFGEKISLAMEKQLGYPTLFVNDDGQISKVLDGNLEASSWSAKQISRQAVEDFLNCLRNIISTDIIVAFDEYRYMGYVKIKNSNISKIASIAESINDSIVLKFADGDDCIIIDYYNDPLLTHDCHFSLFIFGNELGLQSLRCREFAMTPATA